MPYTLSLRRTMHVTFPLLVPSIPEVLDIMMELYTRYHLQCTDAAILDLHLPCAGVDKGNWASKGNMHLSATKINIWTHEAAVDSGTVTLQLYGTSTECHCI